MRMVSDKIFFILGLVFLCGQPKESHAKAD